MGEASAKKNYRNQILADQPNCIFCGGSEPATTVDHLPSKQMFDLKHRPHGMECPACKHCNNSTGPMEMVAALVRRFPIIPPTEKHSKELVKLFLGVKNNFPGLLQRLFESDAEPHPEATLPEGDTAISLDCPRLHFIMEIVGAKLALGFHWLQTRRIVPKNGRISVAWYTNYDRHTNRLPTDIYQYLGAPVTLTQGKFSVRNQFAYQFGLLPSQDAGIYWIAFEPSFAIAAFLFEDGTLMRHTDLAQFGPGQWPTLDVVNRQSLR